MKNKQSTIFLSIVAIFVTLFLGIITTSSKGSYAITSLSNNQQAIIETAKSYLRRGKAIQYDSVLTTYDHRTQQYRNDSKKVTVSAPDPEGSNYLFHPEEADNNNIKYCVCSQFVNNVYYEAFDYYLQDEKGIVLFTENMERLLESRPDIIAANFIGYNNTNTNKYEAEVYEYKNGTSSLSKSYTDDTLTDAATNAYNYIKNIIQEGDILVYRGSESGHAMLYVGENSNLGTNSDGFTYDMVETIRSEDKSTILADALKKVGGSTNAKINNYSKYAYSSKFEPFETLSGIITDNSDTVGTINPSVFQDRFIHFFKKTYKDNKYSDSKESNASVFIIRPLNEIEKTDSNYDLTDAVNFRINNKDLKITKTVSINTGSDISPVWKEIEEYTNVNPGDKLKYSVTIENYGTTTISNLTIEDTIPKGLSYEGTEGSVTPDVNNSYLTYSNISVKKGKKVTIDYIVSISRNLNYYGNTIESNQTIIKDNNGNSLKLNSLKTIISRSITQDENTALNNYVTKIIEKNQEKDYDNTQSFINDVYKNVYGQEVINQNLFDAATDIVENIASSSSIKDLTQTYTYSVQYDNNTDAYIWSYSSGSSTKTDSYLSTVAWSEDDVTVYDLWKNTNSTTLTQKYQNMFVDKLYGGFYTSYYTKEKNKSYSRTPLVTKNTFMPGDVLLLVDSHHSCDSIGNKYGGYVVGYKNLYLYMGNGVFATIKNKKVTLLNETIDTLYLYNCKQKEDKTYGHAELNDGTYYAQVTLGTENLTKINQTERLITSLMGQDLFVVFRPTYTINLQKNITKTEKYKQITKTKYMQGEDLDLTGGQIKIYFDSTQNDNKNNYIVLNLTNSSVTVTGYDKFKVGTQKLTVTYNDVENKDFEVTVEEKTACTPQITGGDALKQTSQTFNVSATNELGITAYYWGKTEPTENTEFTEITNTTAWSKTVEATSSGTYWLGCKDTNGNIGKTNVTVVEYQVYNMQDKDEGIAEIYNKTNYNITTNEKYIIKSGITASPKELYTESGELNTQITYAGYTTTKPEEQNVTLITDNSNITIENGGNYTFWFNRKTYSVTLIKGTGIESVSNGGTITEEPKVYKWGQTVRIDATVSQGYTWNSWTIGNTSTMLTTIKNGNFTVGMSSIAYKANATKINENNHFEVSEDITLNETDNIISNINIGSTLYDLINKIDTNATLTMTDSQNNIVENNDILKTGNILKVKYNEDTIMYYTLSINGDISGYGYISMNDIKLVAKHIINKNIITNKASLIAADYNKDGKIKINDVLKMIRDY